jgi:hypothetical protein
MLGTQAIERRGEVRGGIDQRAVEVDQETTQDRIWMSVHFQR